MGTSTKLTTPVCLKNRGIARMAGLAGTQRKGRYVIYKVVNVQHLNTLCHFEFRATRGRSVRISGWLT